MPDDAVTFDVVRAIGAELPGVAATAGNRGIALKIGGQILACAAIHKSAEPDSLMVRVGLARREVLLAEKPEALYLTAHYQPYPVILVRLTRVDRAYLVAILKEAWEFVRSEGK